MCDAKGFAQGGAIGLHLHSRDRKGKVWYFSGILKNGNPYYPLRKDKGSMDTCTRLFDHSFESNYTPLERKNQLRKKYENKAIEPFVPRNIIQGTISLVTLVK